MIYFSQAGDGLTNFSKISLYQTFSQCSDEVHSEYLAFFWQVFEVCIYSFCILQLLGVLAELLSITS